MSLRLRTSKQLRRPSITSGADKSLARPERKQVTATEDFIYIYIYIYKG